MLPCIKTIDVVDQSGSANNPHHSLYQIQKKHTFKYVEYKSSLVLIATKCNSRF